MQDPLGGHWAFSLSFLFSFLFLFLRWGKSCECYRNSTQRVNSEELGFYGGCRRGDVRRALLGERTYGGGSGERAAGVPSQ